MRHQKTFSDKQLCEATAKYRYDPQLEISYSLFASIASIPRTMFFDSHELMQQIDATRYFRAGFLLIKILGG
jgi:hypothetical protein